MRRLIKISGKARKPSVAIAHKSYVLISFLPWFTLFTMISPDVRAGRARGIHSILGSISFGALRQPYLLQQSLRRHVKLREQ